MSSAVGQTRSIDDVGPVSGLPESGHGWAVYECTLQLVPHHSVTCHCSVSPPWWMSARSSGPSTKISSGTRQGRFSNVIVSGFGGRP